MLLDFHSHLQHFQNLSLILASQPPLLSSLIDHFLPLIVPAQHHFIGNLLNFLPSMIGQRCGLVARSDKFDFESQF